MRFCCYSIALLLAACDVAAPECGAPGCEDALPGTDAPALELDAAIGDAIEADAIPGDALEPDAEAGDAENADAEGAEDADAASDPDAGEPDAPDPDAQATDAAPRDAEICVANDAGPRDAGCGFDPLVRCDNGDHPGLCRLGVCGPCVDGVDDAACAQQYGGGDICIGGVCVPGDCRVDADCDGPPPTMEGRICGLLEAHFCERCYDHGQCETSAQYGPSFRCNSTNGNACEPKLCSFPGSYCSGNDSYCCAAPTGNECVPGRCCVDLDCNSIPGSVCVYGTCLRMAFCPPVTNMLYVSPTGGSDATGNGSQSCPVRTLRRALELVRRSSTPPSEVVLLATGEAPAFGLIVPENVRIVGDPAGGARVLGGGAFILRHPTSGISNLTIDGIGNSVPGWGVQVVGGSTLSTTIDHVTVLNMGGPGIIIRDSSAATIGPGVTSSGNGMGLLVDEGGIAVLEGSLTSDPAERISFSSNAEHGILVRRSSGLSSSGAVFVENNGWAGIRIEQVPSAVTPLVEIDGLVARSNGQPGLPWSGIDIRAASRVRVRGVESLANAESGVRISTYYPSFDLATDDVSEIDLGANAMSDPGRNVLQSSLAGERNAAGICVELSECAGAVLMARGNVFSGPNDCAGPMPAALSRATICSGAVDVASTRGSIIDTGSCP